MLNLMDTLTPFGILRPMNLGFSFAGEGDGAGGGGAGEGEGEGAGGGAATLAPEQWTSLLDETRRNDPTVQKYKTADELAKAHIELQKTLGMDKLPLPKKPYQENPDEYGLVFDRLGRPSDPNAYEIPEIKDLPENFPKASEEELKEFKGLAHKIGLMPHQVKALYEYQVNKTKGGIETSAKSQEEFYLNSEKTLRKEFGQAFDQNVSLANKALKKFGDAELEGLLQQGLGSHPAFVRFMVKVSKNFGEDGAFLGEGQSVTGTKTPQEALAEIAKINGERAKDPKHPLNSKLHPEYRAMTDRMSDLFKMAYPETQPQQ